MPREGRCGRKKLGELARTEHIMLLLRPAEVEVLDRLRGPLRRGAYCSRLVREWLAIHSEQTGEVQEAQA